MTLWGRPQLAKYCRSRVLPLAQIHAGMTIGRMCKVGGEVSNSMFGRREQAWTELDEKLMRYPAEVAPTVER